MSHNMLGAINEFGKRYNKSWVWEDATSFVNVPQQHMNDCGVVVNELSRRLMINESWFWAEQKCGCQVKSDASKRNSAVHHAEGIELDFWIPMIFLLLWYYVLRLPGAFHKIPPPPPGCLTKISHVSQKVWEFATLWDVLKYSVSQKNLAFPGVCRQSSSAKHYT